VEALRQFAKALPEAAVVRNMREHDDESLLGGKQLDNSQALPGTGSLVVGPGVSTQSGGRYFIGWLDVGTALNEASRLSPLLVEAECKERESVVLRRDQSPSLFPGARLVDALLEDEGD
jgi:hypothetical protein